MEEITALGLIYLHRRVVPRAVTVVVSTVVNLAQTDMAVGSNIIGCFF